MNTISELRGIIRKIADEVIALLLCIPSDDASYLFKRYENFFDSSVTFGPVVSEKKSFESVDGRQMDDGGFPLYKIKTKNVSTEHRCPRLVPSVRWRLV